MKWRWKGWCEVEVKWEREEALGQLEEWGVGSSGVGEEAHAAPSHSPRDPTLSESLATWVRLLHPVGVD